ncbi:hypothetical protein ZWY2020_020269 [Hordeum vulgare]|nr:hypothetical protein ZWY2020_020269 [Hordeum vulgare]
MAVASPRARHGSLLLASLPTSSPCPRAGSHLPARRRRPRPSVAASSRVLAMPTARTRARRTLPACLPRAALHRHRAHCSPPHSARSVALSPSVPSPCGRPPRPLLRCATRL